MVGKKVKEVEMKNLNFNLATFVGIDAHQEEHTAMAINRFEEEKGRLRFENTQEGISQFLLWLKGVDADKNNLCIGIEGGGSGRKTLFSMLARQYPNIFEVNPLYTKQRRDYGTKGNKSDPVDAKLIAEVLTRKLSELPKVNSEDFSPQKLSLRKTVWFYEEQTVQGARIKNQLRWLLKERQIAQSREEKQTLNLIIKEKKENLRKIVQLRKKLENNLDSLLSQNQATNLTSMRGVSTILAARVIAHTKGIERFSKIDKFIKYAGIAPLEKSSGKSVRHIRNKKGNRKLNAAIYLVALNQLRWNPKAKKYFQKKVKEGKTKKQALRCLMKRVACIVYGMLKRKENYRG